VGQCPAWWSSPCRTQVAPSVQRRKVWLTPTTRCHGGVGPSDVCLQQSLHTEVWLTFTTWLPCSNTAKTRNKLGCPKLPGRSQPLVGRSLPYCEDVWSRYCCLTSFFPIADKCLSCEDIAPQSCTMVPRWRLFGDFWVLHFSASRVQHVSDLHPKFALRPYHILRPLRLGQEKRKKKKEETTGQKYTGLPYSIRRS